MLGIVLIHYVQSSFFPVTSINPFLPVNQDIMIYFLRDLVVNERDCFLFSEQCT